MAAAVDEQQASKRRRVLPSASPRVSVPRLISPLSVCSSSNVREGQACCTSRSSKGSLKGEGGTTPTYLANVPCQRPGPVVIASGACASCQLRVTCAGGQFWLRASAPGLRTACRWGGLRHYEHAHLRTSNIEKLAPSIGGGMHAPFLEPNRRLRLLPSCPRTS